MGPLNRVDLSDRPPLVLPYRPPWWLPGGHLQTIYPSLFAPAPQVAYRRERWDAPDGDFIDADWIDGASPTAPLVVLFHGLEGSSHSHYARSVMGEARRRGWQGMVAHFRGCSGEPNRRPRAYHSGDSDEIDWILRRARAARPGVPLYAAGISLGGNALAKWAGERGESARFVTAAAAVGAPLDLAAGGHALARGFNRLYTRWFLLTMKRKATEKYARFPELARGGARARALGARTLFEFDDAFTAPLHGFRDATDYWSRASGRPWLAAVTLPLLVLNSVNDPFVPAASLPTAADVSRSVVLDRPENGGHIGFAQGPFPGALEYLPQRLFAFFATGA